MTWPRKGTRSIIVDGASFLWHVDDSRVGWGDAPITVGRARTKFVLHLDTFSWGGTPKPSIVADAIRWAVSKGWTAEAGPTRRAALVEPGRFVFLPPTYSGLPTRADDQVFFEVERVLDLGTTVLAARLGEGNFRLRPETRLGEARVEPHLSMPRALHPDGSPRFDLFAFAMQEPARAREFAVGQLVILGPVDARPESTK